jgi:BMFP domain-containing protein YqiC
MAAERPRFFDDLAGVAGGAMSALSGLREELESMMRARVDETIRKLDLVRREQFDGVADMAAKARAGQELAESRLTALEIRVAALETAGRAAPGDAIVLPSAESVLPPEASDATPGMS